MKKSNNILAFSLLGGLALLAAGCVKEADMNEKYRPEGTPIIFSAATGYENGDGTRTEYSGHFFDNNQQEVTGSTLSSYANTWERIDWVSADPVVIHYDRASATSNYQVSSIDANSEKSDAGIEVSSGSSKLVWAGGSGNHVFTAMYPKNGFGTPANNSISFNGATGAVGGLIPATQTLRSVGGKYLPQMQYAYMLARKTIDGSSTEHTVALPFKPAFTAFEFRLRRPATLGNGSTASFKVKSFTISSTSPLAGNFNLTIDGEDSRGATWSATPTVTNNGNKSNSVTVTFNGNTGVDLSTSADLDFTLLTLPTPIADLKLTLTFADAGNTTKSITLKEGGVNKSFAPCKKYIITNSKAGFDEWEYIVEPIADMVTYGHETVSAGFEVRSYKQSKADPSIKVAVPWKIQYTLNPDAASPTWTDLTSSGYNNSSMATTVFKIRNSGDTGDGFTGNGSVPGTSKEARTSKIEGTHNSYNTYGSGAAAATRAKMAAASPRGSAVGVGNGPFDLSRHPFYGNNIDGTPGNINSANCYIVSAPGVYMFPCIYGNAITNGSDNKSAYWPSSATDAITGDASTVTQLSDVNTEYNVDGYVQHYYTPRFYNAVNAYITSPYIKDDLNSYAAVSGLNAAVVWQDTHPNDEIIPYESGTVGMTTVTVGAKTMDYIWFKIDPENIKPGNIVIALRGRVGTILSETTNILWSWHIWVTEKDLAPSDVITNASGSYQLMPFNLGWADTEDGGVVRYDDRELQYRVVQVEGGTTLTGADNIEEFTMTQNGDSKETLESVGGNPYYQWGRKDPMIPALPNGHSRPVSPNSEYSSVITTDGSLIPCTTIQGTSTSPDYGAGIRLPYAPLSNVSTTTWIGGTVYPYYIYAGYNYIYTPNGSGPYDQAARDQWVANGLRPEDFAQYRYYRYNPNGTGPYAYWSVINTYSSLNRSDFTDTYTALEREKASCPSNLWNSYQYTQTAACKANKFKTVYDPCPAGFTVPSKEVFIATTPFTYITDDPPVNGFKRMYSPTNVKVTTPKMGTSRSATDKGVTFDGVFFPYTGARVFYNEGGTIALKAEAGTTGFYWSDCAETIEPNNISSPVIDNNIGNYWFYNHSLILMCSQNSDAVQSYTRGSAGCIRPMLETNPRDL